MLNPALWIVTLLPLIGAALLLAQFARRQQEQRVLSLYRLSALEQRRRQLEDAMEMFQQLGAAPEIMDTLGKALLHDLQRMLSLDPLREDLQRSIGKLEKGGRKKTALPDSEQAAVESENELRALRVRIQQVLELLQRLQKAGFLERADVLQVRESLEMLLVRVGINSFMLMARHALDGRNIMRAFSCYRKAERLARFSRLPEAQLAASLAMIEREKERLIMEQDSDEGLLLLASADHEGAAAH